MKRIYNYLFNAALATTNSTAQFTLRDAMVEWWMASDNEDAMRQITTSSGKDLAGITNSVLSGLNKAAELLGCDPILLISEADLLPLRNLNAPQIYLVLDAIHKQWIDDNWNPNRLVEKFVRGQLNQYQKISRICWEETRKDLLFFQHYLLAAGSCVAEDDIRKVHEEHSSKDDSTDLHLYCYKKIALTSFGNEIIHAAESYIEANRTKNPDRAQKASDLLAANSNDGEKVLAEILRGII